MAVGALGELVDRSACTDSKDAFVLRVPMQTLKPAIYFLLISVTSGGLPRAVTRKNPGWLR
jgi:hypothetical protein